jgi:hypothetical protein
MFRISYSSPLTERDGDLVRATAETDMKRAAKMVSLLVVAVAVLGAYDHLSPRASLTGIPIDRWPEHLEKD